MKPQESRPNQTKPKLVQTNFLNVTFNFNSGKYWPYRKPNQQPLYVHHHLNHTPTIKKQLPLMLADRLSLLSYNREKFTRAIPQYEKAMRRSVHSGELQYNSPPDSHKRKPRKRNVVWFNPPFSEHVKSNIGKVFLHLLEKHFPPHHRLHKICNKNNVKVSCSCIPNMVAIISKHNKALLTQRTEPANTVPPCNCRAKNSFPMKGLYHESSIIYKATLTSDGIAKNYHRCSVKAQLGPQVSFNRPEESSLLCESVTAKSTQKKQYIIKTVTYRSLRCPYWS